MDRRLSKRAERLVRLVRFLRKRVGWTKAIAEGSRITGLFSAEVCPSPEELCKEVLGGELPFTATDERLLGHLIDGLRNLKWRRERGDSYGSGSVVHEVITWRTTHSGWGIQLRVSYSGLDHELWQIDESWCDPFADDDSESEVVLRWKRDLRAAQKELSNG